MKWCSSRQGAGGGHSPVEALLRATRAERPWSPALKVAVGASPPEVLMPVRWAGRAGHQLWQWGSGVAACSDKS